jgi:hypothetical protein
MKRPTDLDSVNGTGTRAILVPVPITPPPGEADTGPIERAAREATGPHPAVSRETRIDRNVTGHPEPDDIGQTPRCANAQCTRYGQRHRDMCSYPEDLPQGVSRPELDAVASEVRKVLQAGGRLDDAMLRGLMAEFAPGDLPNDLEPWWRRLTETDIEKTAPKTAEYGSHDLEIMGRTLVAAYPMPEGADLDRIGQEIAVAFYLLGKVGRLFSAWQNGKEPSPDTIFDLRIYSTMLARIREFGGWPE